MFKRITILSLIVSSAVLVRAQSGPLQEIRGQFVKYREKSLQEKLFVHIDKSFYLAGEILWFKIYDVDGSLHKPLDLSKVVYVDLLDNSSKAVVQAKIGISDGKGEGSFFLPVTTRSGNYTFRAYTSWMKNFSSEYFFEQPITIVNTLKSPDPKPQPDSLSYFVQFFPEGGNLVRGLRSKLAFEIANRHGRGIDNCKGYILNQNNDTVIRFQPSRFGKGNFYFTPEANLNYRAVVIGGSNNRIIEKDLPAIMDRGYVMNLVDSASDKIKVSVTVNTRVPDQVVYLFIHSRGLIDATQVQELKNNRVEFLVDKSMLGDGISQLTVFNAAKEPMCERLYFKRPQGMKLEVTVNQNQFKIRDRVNVEISNAGIAVPSDLSMSVFLIDSLQSSDHSDILSYLWLQSDLKGYIESPGFYFNQDNPGVDEATDNLMLTHGWRRFEWDNVLNDRYPPIENIPEIEGHILKGKLTDKKSGAPAPNILTYLSVPNQKQQFCAAVSDANGNIHFDLKDFYGSEDVILQTNGQKDSIYHVTLLSPFSERYSTRPTDTFRLSSGQQEQLLERSINAQVQNAYLSEQLKRFLNPFSDSSAFYGVPDKRYLLDDYTRFTTMEDVLREYVPEVLIKRENGKLHLRVARPDRGFFEEDPLTLVDGVPYFNPDSIMGLDPLKIRKLDVMTRNYFMGPSTSQGVVSFISYKNDLSGISLEPNAVVIEYEGLQLKREFYSPVYENDSQRNDRMPDFRNVLMWTPNISLPANGKASSTFYTSDQAGKYAILVQGISENGEAGSKLITFDVKN